jgi:hypothetical protein
MSLLSFRQQEQIKSVWNLMNGNRKFACVK